MVSRTYYVSLFVARALRARLLNRVSSKQDSGKTYMIISVIAKQNSSILASFVLFMLGHTSSSRSTPSSPPRCSDRSAPRHWGPVFELLVWWAGRRKVCLHVQGGYTVTESVARRACWSWPRIHVGRKRRWIYETDRAETKNEEYSQGCGCGVELFDSMVTCTRPLLW